MVQVSVDWSGQLEVAETDVVKGFIVNAVGFISVLHQMMDREGGVLGLNHSVGHFG